MQNHTSKRHFLKMSEVQGLLEAQKGDPSWKTTHLLWTACLCPPPLSLYAEATTPTWWYLEVGTSGGNEV